MAAFDIDYHIGLPDDADGDAFAQFMTDEYLPAVHKGPTRVGQVQGLVLLREVTDTHEPTNHFHLRMAFDGLATGQVRIDDDAVQARFDGFGATLERREASEQVASWAPTSE